MEKKFVFGYEMEQSMYFDCQHSYFQRGKDYKGRCIVEYIHFFYLQENPAKGNQVIIGFKDSNGLVGNLTLLENDGCGTSLSYDDLDSVIKKEPNLAFKKSDIVPKINTSSGFEKGVGYNKDQEYVTIEKDYYSYFETCVHPILLCGNLDWWVNLLFKLIEHTQDKDARTTFETATQKPLVPKALRQDGELEQEITDLLSNPKISKNIYLKFPPPEEAVAEESSGGARKCKKQRKKRSRKSRGLRKSKKSKARKSIRKTRSKKRRSKRSN